MEVKISISSKNVDLIKIKDKRKGEDSEKNKIKKKIYDSENSCTIELSNKKMSLNKPEEKIEDLPEISNKLVNMGYSVFVIKYVFNRYKFKSFEQALWILGTNPETDKYNHYFYIPTGKIDTSNSNYTNLCYICKDVFDKHERCIEDLIENRGTQESQYKLLTDVEDSKENDEVLLKLKEKNNQANPNRDFLLKLGREFEKENLCIICYEKEITPQSSFSLECKHNFCLECVKSYLETKINLANIENLKCLNPGCQIPFKEKTIERIVTPNIFYKYLVIKNKEEMRLRLQNGYIPCTFPDCQELVFYKDGKNPLVFCSKKHRFCAICKEAWHKYKDCKNNNEKIKMCPKCNMFIEKEGGCNHIICEMCKYEFCWLCLKKYEFYHYYVFNMRGCPGMRHSKSSQSKIYENRFFNCIWYVLVIILSLIAITLLVGFFFIFGASYEFIKCYLISKRKKLGKKVPKTTADNLANPTDNDRSLNKIANRHEGRMISSCLDVLIIISLVICGIAVQPFFLIFKFLEMMMECYRTYGCLFFWFCLCDY